jgi:predicted  nucleic acid-binding Zn-ribbon protein
MTSNELYEVEIKKLLIEIREKETELHALKSVKSSVNHELVEAKTYICKLQQKIIYDQEKATKEQTKAMEQFQTAKEEVCELKKTVQVEKDAKKALTNKLRHAVRLRKAYYAELKALKEGNPAKYVIHSSHHDL